MVAFEGGWGDGLRAGVAVSGRDGAAGAGAAAGDGNGEGEALQEERGADGEPEGGPEVGGARLPLGGGLEEDRGVEGGEGEEGVRVAQIGSGSCRERV